MDVKNGKTFLPTTYEQFLAQKKKNTKLGSTLKNSNHAYEQSKENRPIFKPESNSNN